MHRSHDRLIPAVAELITLNRAAKHSYEAGLSEYPGSTAWKFPFALSWKAEPSTPDREAARQWLTEDLGKYLDYLSRYFVDWVEQPAKLDRLALTATLSVCGEATSRDHIHACLDAEFRSLGIGQQKGHKRAEAKRQKSARAERGIRVTPNFADLVSQKKGPLTWEAFAAKIGLDPKTLWKARTVGRRIDRAAHERILVTPPPAELD